MSLRALEKLGFFGALAIGAALTPGAISGDAGRVLATFLGLLSASVLPTVTLLVNSMTATGRSVYALNKLEAELQSAMDALFLMFGSIGVAIAALLALSITPPTFLSAVPYLTTDVLPRIGQALVAGASALVLGRAGQIPGILRRTLKLRHEIAIAEAREKIEKNAPDANAIRRAFATHPDHGKVVSLQDLQGQDRR